MPDRTSHQRILDTFAALLQGLSVTWPGQDFNYVKTYITCGEYGEALEKLIALGLRNPEGLNVAQSQQIMELAGEIGLVESAWLDRLDRFLAEAAKK